MTSSISSASGRSPITLAAGFLGAFIVGSLAVQLVRSQTASVQAGAAGVEPVIAGPAGLWAPLSIAAVTAPQPLCPITINSGVLRTLTLYSTEAMASVKAVLPALRITKSSPGVVSNTQFGDTRESEQVSTVAQGCWLLANALGS